MFEPFITGLLWFKKLPEVKALADAFEKHLWPCRRAPPALESFT